MRIDQRSKHIRAFLEYLEMDRHFSPLTAVSYSKDLEQFADYLIESGGELDDKILAADALNLQSYINGPLRRGGYKITTIARKTATLRSFYKWLRWRRAISSNPMELIRSPKQRKRIPRVLTKREVQQLLSGFDQRKTLGVRDWALFTTVYWTGLKVQELLAMNRGGIWI